MSSRIHKKQLSILDNVVSLTDQELREALKKFNQAPGPITATTRSLYRNKLASLIEKDKPIRIQDDVRTNQVKANEVKLLESKISEPKPSASKAKANVVETEELDSSELDSFDASTSPSLSWFKKVILTILVVFISLPAIYPYLPVARSFRALTLYAIIILLASPVIYGLYSLFKYISKRRDTQNLKVCSLVNDALELLQSPENPKRMMPVLHIRDTLFTPAERNSKKMIKLWKECVDFVEQHESRVKVEMVNVDGEDFRAWKWIGSRK